MRLTLSCSGSYTSPTHSISNILWHNRIEEFCCCGYSHICNIDHQLSCHNYAILHIFRSIEMGITNESFPSDICPRFFKVDTHNYFQNITCLFSYFSDFFCIFFCGLHVMNRAGSYYNGYFLIFALDHVSECLDALFSYLSSLF